MIMESSRPVSERGTSRNSSIFGSAHTVNRRLIESPAGCGIQPRTLNVENDLEVEDYGSVGSDLELSDSDDYGEYEYDDEQAEEEEFGENALGSERRVQKTATAPHDDDDDLDSDEERAIVAHIKEEIKNQVRGEMKSELDLYITPEGGAKRHHDNDDPTLADLEPKLREAILRMRKYDRILARKEKREMQVKRERLRLQKRLRQELEDLKNGLDCKQPRKEELVNTEKFLALAPPPTHNEGVEDVTPPATPVTPVFATQLPDSEFNSKSTPTTGERDAASSTPRGKENAGIRTTRSRSDGSTTTTTDASTTGASTSLGSKMSESDSSLGGSRKGKKKNKDFIKRNIELAGDAANMIAMTDEEKCRLDQLLRDISNLPDIPEDGDKFLTQAFEVALVAGEGFSADQSQREQLSRIDDRLSVLMPATEFRAISSAKDLDALKHCQYLSSSMRVSMDLEKLGEPTLQETKEEREMRLKLEVVERQLQHLSVHADLEVATPAHLSQEALSLLLGEYAQCLSTTTQSPFTNTDEEDITDRGRPAVASIYDNVPRLDDVTLQRLLREARSGMSYNELENESDDCKVLNMGNATDRSLESYDVSHRSSRLSRPTSDTRPTTTQRPTTGDLDLRRADDLDRPDSEPRVLLPEINATRCMVAQITTLNQHDPRPTSRDRRSDNFVRSNFEQNVAVSAVSPPLTAPPRRPPSRPRNLAPISTHLDLELSDDEQ